MIVTTLVTGVASASFTVAVPAPAVLLGAMVKVTLPVASVVPEVADSVPAPPVVAAVENASGTPCCTGVIVAVSVRAAPPAVNVVALVVKEVNPVAAVELTAIVGPEYEAPLVPPSINAVVNDWVMAGDAAAERGPSREPNAKITENPGANDPPAHRTAVAVVAPEFVKVHPLAHVPAEAEMFQFAGATKVTEVIGKALDAGLATVTVNPEVTV